jgi:tetratricopeptide (TPR) repeat protein
VGGFVNKTGNPDLDKILTSAVALELQESPWLNIIPDRRFRAMVLDPDADPLSHQIQACLSLHGTVLLGGQILTASHGYRLMLMAWRCRDGRLLTTQTGLAESKTTILSALDAVSQKMRAQLGEPDDSLKRFNVPLVQATTTSLSALRAFTLGEEQRTRGQESESISDYQLAADLDPQFALAYARLGTIYYNTGEFALSQKNYQRAFQLRGRTTDRERLYITSHYYANSTGETQRAIEAYQLWHAMYPRDMAPINNLAIEDLLIGQPENVLPLARMAVQLDPVTSQPYATLIQAYLMTGDYRDLNEACAHPPEGKSDGIVFHESCFKGAFAQNDDTAMQRQAQWAHGNPRESSILNDLGMAAVFQGKIAAARQYFSSAEENALKYKFPENAAQIYLNEALAEADLGYTQAAKTDALAALEISPESPTVEAIAALALARVGDTAHAQTEADHAATEMPLNTILNSALLPSARAAVELHNHQPATAIQTLEEARPFDFSYLLAFAPAYLRGLAYLDSGEPGSAAAEFQRVLDRRAIAPDSPYIALSTFQLGRARQLAGDAAAASALYRDTENIWRDADPGFPPLRLLQRYESEVSAAATK